MPYLLQEVKDEGDFDEMLGMLHTAFEEPYNPLHHWFMPVYTTTEDTIQATKQRIVKHWSSDDNLFWLKVIDTETGKIVGVAEWAIRESITHPGEPQKPIEAQWHPEGSDERIFTGKLVTSLKGFMKERMTRPHVELEQLAVAQEHRRRGVATLLMNWGKQKADKLGVESCIESVPSAVPAYLSLGYGDVDDLRPDVAVENPSEIYQEFVKQDLRVVLMWRPIGRDYDVLNDNAPWRSV
ncbi:putative GNAT family acetyltransferase [Rosellinia necatrix]|uniref:Putative GNAT family acetyltransferase n=1 Tax=Rosellinia necatrix TaxID=77044 RepID=A0A1W2TQA1_ROSNE|nr:putative GNAT family acetyltransferase [Rosellinia necatrix]